MAGFLYYVPGGKRGIQIGELSELAYAFEGGIVSHDVVADGPDGGSGVVVVDRGFPTERLGYYPERQTWRKLPGTRYHVGFDREYVPTPQALVRARPLNGHLVRLADDRQWLAPMALQQIIGYRESGIANHKNKPSDSGDWMGRASALPTAATLDDDGRWVAGEPLAKYARLWEIACAWWDRVMAGVLSQVPEEQRTESPSSGVEVSFAFEGLMESACEVLAVNYRVGPAEIAMLRLFDEQTAVDVLQAAVDWPTLLRWLQKKTPESQSVTSDG